MNTKYSIIGVVSVCVIGLVGGVYYFNGYEQENFNGAAVETLPPPPYDGTYFTHPRYGYEFLVPDGMTHSIEVLGTASAIVSFRNASSTKWFQIFITPYGGEKIGSDRIAKDTGSSEIHTPQDIVFGSQKTSASMFWYTHPQLGTLRDIWFTANGFLFEVTAQKDEDEWIATILDTFTFSAVDINGSPTERKAVYQ